MVAGLQLPSTAILSAACTALTSSGLFLPPAPTDPLSESTEPLVGAPDVGAGAGGLAAGAPLVTAGAAADTAPWACSKTAAPALFTSSTTADAFCWTLPRNPWTSTPIPASQESFSSLIWRWLRNDVVASDPVQFELFCN